MSESEEKDLREKTSLFSGLPQRVIIVCFEMGIPYFKVRRGTRLRTQGPWVSSRLALVLGKGAKERERILENGISLTLVTNGCNAGWCVDVSPARRVESPVLELVSASRQGPREGDHQRWACERSPAVVDLPSWVLAPECKVSAEKKQI